MNKVQCRLCEVRLKDEEQEFVVNALDIMKKDVYYPAAHIIDPDSDGKIYVVYTGDIFVLVSSDGVDEKPEDNISEIVTGDIKQIKEHLSTLEFYQHVKQSLLPHYNIGIITAIKDTHVENNVEGSTWKEMFNEGDSYVSVRPRGTHEMAVQVRKGAIFYVGTQDLENFNVKEVSFGLSVSTMTYAQIKEVKYIISNLYKKERLK